MGWSSRAARRGVQGDCISTSDGCARYRRFSRLFSVIFQQHRLTGYGLRATRVSDTYTQVISWVEAFGGAMGWKIDKHTLLSYKGLYSSYSSFFFFSRSVAKLKPCEIVVFKPTKKYTESVVLLTYFPYLT